MDFDADHPIERHEQDRLGRASLAEAIAEQVRAIPAEHGFTIVLHGEWGSGKTSLLNMVAETLENDKDVATVLRFNPWLFGSAADLVTLFFREVSAQMGEGKADELKEVAKALVGLGQTLAPLSPATGTTWVAGLAAGLVGQWAKAPSLRQKRDRLRKALKRTDSRIVVLIDDIDRLEQNETQDLIRLVRLTSDLPNLVFLLAFDRHRVAKSLGTDGNEAEGQQYLDKIVQLSYDVPVVREKILSRMLATWLEELVGGRDVLQLERDVWGRVFFEVIQPLVGNLRDVKRYLYSLPVTLDTIGREVALADLLGLEALRVLKPSLFRELKAHATCLVHSRSGMPMAEDKRKERLSAMLDSAEADRDVLNSVLEILFPATQGALGSTHYGPGSDAAWRKRRRVASEDVLRVYLEAGLDEAALPSKDIQDLVDALTDEEKLLKLLSALDGERLEDALERLEDFERDFPKEAVPIAVPILLNQMGRLSGEFTGFLGFSPRLRATRVVYRLLRRFEDREALMGIMNEMLNSVETLSGRLHLVEMVGHRDSVGHRLVSESHAKELEGQLVEQLKVATVEELTEEWELFNLLVGPLLWLEGVDEARLAARLREHLDDDEFVVALLRTAVSYARHSDGRAEKRIPWDFLAETIGEGLASAVDRVIHSRLYRSLPEEDQDTLELAQKYASGWRPDEWGARE